MAEVSASVVLAEATAQLTAAGSASPAADARLLLAHLLGLPLGRLAMAGELAEAQATAYRDLVDRRATGIPVQHLTGVAAFRYVEVGVGPGVFVPRPETEVMVGWAVDRLAELVAAGVEQPVVVDACTGSGVIAKALAHEVPTARIHACEVSEAAYDRAVANLAGTGVDVVCADLADAFDDLAGAVDLVICNPPYIPLEAWESVTAEVRDHDPSLALFSGADGLDVMRVLTVRAAHWLRPGGLVAAEHAEVQETSAPAVFVAQGDWELVRDHRDLTGRPRFTTARRRAAAGGQ
ncbi:peptide chain release factor N(5)-glutamine methyltransferase [Microlunatus sp. Y2014]|uniref:peptide chain release factor N(5)-glutamine methyltransferase n=1 Tax=Microlunatus sp. Y2014 TaxID=3418488 RepID=UPI003DA74AE3